MKRILAVCLALAVINAWASNNETIDSPQPAAGMPAGAGAVWRAPSAVLFSNGTFQSAATGGGLGGTAPVSVLTPPDTTFGLGCTGTGLRLADDFVVPAGGWNVDKITVFGYQTQGAPGGSTVSTMTAGFVRIWNGPPNVPASNVVVGDTTTNRLTATSFSGVWRAQSTTLTNGQRPIMAVEMGGLAWTLPAGTYWLEYGITGSTPSGPFCPPNTSVSAANNALQFNVGTAAWVAMTDMASARPLDVPFVIESLAAAAPVFSYTPPVGSTVAGTGGGAIGSTSNFSIAAAIGSAGSGTGTAATTTTTCTVPTAPFAGFGQTVTASGTGAITGGPLSGTCTRGETALTQTLTCSENRGGTAAPVTWTLSCPAGTPVAGTFTVGGSVTGLAGTGLVLRNNGGNDLNVAANGAFTFTMPVASGAAYAVTVFAQPSTPTQVCTVSNGSGTVGAADITNIAVTCVTSTFTVGGTVTGLAGTGLVLRNNAGNDLAVAANGAFTFTTPVASGSAFAVTVFAQPGTPTQVCTVTNGSGTIAGANISNVTVICTTSGGDPTITPVATSRATGSPMYRSVIANVSDAAGAGNVLVTVNSAASATVNGVLLQAIQNNNGVISAAIRGGCFSPISPPVISFTLTASSSSGSNTANLPITVTAGSNPTWCQWWPR